MGDLAVWGRGIADMSNDMLAAALRWRGLASDTVAAAAETADATARAALLLIADRYLDLALQAEARQDERSPAASDGVSPQPGDEREHSPE
jgi:hypothetical protein